VADRPDNKEQDADRQELLAERMSRLREAARQDRKYFGELVVEELPADAGHKRLWLMLAAAGVVAVGGLVLVIAMLSGGGSSGPSTPADGSGQQQVPGGSSSGSNPASAKTPTRQPGQTPAPDVKSEDPKEGAVAPGTVRQIPSDGPSIQLILPIRGSFRVVESFGTARGSLTHGGIDLASTTITPFDVIASCDGRIAGVLNQEEYGDFVVIDCGNGWRIIYGQLASIAVKAGDNVTAGKTVIGTTGRFLHFELRYNGAPVDPAPFLTAAAATASATPTATVTGTPGATATPKPGETPAPTPTADSPAGGGGSGPPGPQPIATRTPTPTPRPENPTPTPRPVVR
jgi:hypothetical protein